MCIRDRLGAELPDPRYRLALRALAMAPLCQIINTPLPLCVIPYSRWPSVVLWWFFYWKLYATFAFYISLLRLTLHLLQFAGDLLQQAVQQVYNTSPHEDRKPSTNRGHLVQLGQQVYNNLKQVKVKPISHWQMIISIRKFFKLIYWLKNFENQSAFGEDMDKGFVSRFLTNIVYHIFVKFMYQ